MGIASRAFSLTRDCQRRASLASRALPWYHITMFGPRRGVRLDPDRLRRFSPGSSDPGELYVAAKVRRRCHSISVQSIIGAFSIESGPICSSLTGGSQVGGAEAWPRCPGLRCRKVSQTRLDVDQPLDCESSRSLASAPSGGVRECVEGRARRSQARPRGLAGVALPEGPVRDRGSGWGGALWQVRPGGPEGSRLRDHSTRGRSGASGFDALSEVGVLWKYRGPICLSLTDR